MAYALSRRRANNYAAPFLQSEPIAAAFESRHAQHTMDRLHLDAKLSIAHTSIAAWNALMRADPVFGRYAISDIGRSAFLSAFTVEANGMWTVGCKLHRVGGPARTYSDGTKVWYEYGQRHRIGGPARTYAGGSLEWWERDQLHRVDGPACIYANGSKEWYKRGKWHRIGYRTFNRR